EKLSMEARMTICNMSIEMGARGGMIAPDDITFEYMKGRKFVPSTSPRPLGEGQGEGSDWDKAVTYWKTLKTDKGAKYDKEIVFDAKDIEPMVTYGTNPGMGIKVTQQIPTEDMFETVSEKNGFRGALEYMGLTAGKPIVGQKVDYVFLGSCTNSRMEDYRNIAQIVRGKKKPEGLEVLVVPGSRQVQEQLRQEGLDKVFEEVGFEMRGSGCSACLGMNEDKIPAGKYCISTSNRNFQGRQGPGSRTFLASPITAAAAAITGVITDVREML
ncbi:MAG TPA: aconitase family protein, partial [Candidatus Andersenbacteria bacterium]|nr:aconitase family protein [Candidatus Andersenbacteria bacterium]